MKGFSLSRVLRETPKVFLYYILGSIAGLAFGYLMFAADRSSLEALLNMWSKRLLLGIELGGGDWNALWFILNNLAVMLVVIGASVFILVQISRKPLMIRKFKRFREPPKMTMFGLYIVPIGAMVLNGFLIAMFASYIYLAYGIESFTSAVVLMIPHGINEILALTLACSLGIASINAIKPYVMKGQSEKAIKVGKSILRSKATFYILIIIATLIVFSGMVESLLSTLI